MAKRLICVIISVLMIVSLLPASAFATGTTEKQDYSVFSVTSSTGTTMYYDDADDAISSIEDGSTLTIISDYSAGLTLNVNKTYTLDLGGSSYGLAGTLVVSSGNVTLKNGIISCEYGNGIEVVASGDSANPTTLTVESSVTIYNCVNGIYIKPSSSDSTNGSGVVVTMNGTIKTFTNAGIYVADSITTCGTTDVITVNGTVNGWNSTWSTSAKAGIAIAGAANVVVNTGASIFGDTGIEVRAGSLTVNGGTITCNDDSGTITVTESGTGIVSDGCGIAIVKNSNNLPITVTVTGGTIKGTAALYEKQVVSPVTTSDITVNLSGGTFGSVWDLAAYDEGDFPVVISANLTGFITGGTYATDVTQYISSSCSVTQDSTYSYTVTSAQTTGVAKNVTQNISTYATLQDAIDAANEKDEIALLDDVKEDITIDYTDTITLDLAGYTLDGSITITGGDLTLKDSSTEQSGTVTGGVTVNSKVVFSGSYFVLTDGSYISTSSFAGEYSDIDNDYDGLALAGTGSFTMNGGTISGGVTVSNNSSFTMTDGTISNASGSGVKLNEAGQTSQVFTVVLNSDGTINSISENQNITDNLANYFTMKGGTITGCSTTGNGGGVYVGSACIFTMSAGTITGNNADTGGGVCVCKTSVNEGYATFTMTGGAIYGNSATTEGSDIYTGDGHVTIISASSMTGCSDYVWYTDASSNRYTDSNITTEVTETTFTESCTSLIAVTAVATPKLYGRTLTLDGQIGVTFYFDMTGVDDPDSYYILASGYLDTFGYKTTDRKVDAGTTKEIDGVTYYRYTVYINPALLNYDEISITMTNGTTTTGTYTYSVATYCSKAIANSWAEADLCKALMNYSNYVNKYFIIDNGTFTITNYDASWQDPVANWNVELTTEDSGEEVTYPTNVTSVGASLDLQSEIVLRFYLNASSVDGLTVQIEYEDGTVASTTLTEDSSQTGYTYSIEVQIPAKKLNDTFTLSITDSEGNKYTYDYSVENYIADALEMTVSREDYSSDGEYAEAASDLNNLQNLCKAIYFYKQALASYNNWQ